MSALEIKQLLNDFGLKPNKALGQNFLCDERVALAILDAAEINGKHVLEVGPGLGALTLPLAQRARKLAAVEIDAALFFALKERFPNAKNVRLIHCDFLKLDLNALCADFFDGAAFSVVANLPYYVTTPICMALLNAELPVSSMTLMLQKEAAERFFAAPSARVYGPLTVLAQRYYSIKKVLSLSPAAYYPEPEVDSVVIRLTRKTDVPFQSGLPRLLQAAFSMRRKTLLNNLKPLFDSPEALMKTLSACGISPGNRAEALAPEAFARLAEEMAKEKTVW